MRIWVLTIGILMQACATPAPKAAASLILMNEANCPDKFETAAWPGLPEACRGRLALERSAQFAAARRWAEALEWAERASATLPPALIGFAQFRRAEARYALGQTGQVETDLGAAAAANVDAGITGAAHYYLAEISAARSNVTAAVEHLGAALQAEPNAAWRPAAEALLGAIARESGATLNVQSFEESNRPLAKFLTAEAAARGGRPGDALKLYRELAAEAQIASWGLLAYVQNQADELALRGSPKPGMVGLVLPFSGRAAPFGWMALRGLLLSLNPFIDPAVVLQIENDRGEPYRSVRALRSLAAAGSMVAVGPLAGKGADGGAASVQTLGLPTVVLSSSESLRLAPWAVRGSVSPSQQIAALLDLTMGRRGFKRFAILYPDDGFGAGMRDLFWSAVIARGGEITGAESYAAGKTDFKAAIQGLTGASEFSAEELKRQAAAKQPVAPLDFDGLFIPDGAKTVGLIIPQLLYYDVRGPVFLGPSTWNDIKLLTLDRDYAEGSLFTDWYWPDSLNKFSENFVARYLEAYGDARPLTISAQAYEAGVILREPAKEPNRLAARTVLYKQKWESFAGPARVSPSGEVERRLDILTVAEKKVVPIED